MNDIDISMNDIDMMNYSLHDFSYSKEYTINEPKKNTSIVAINVPSWLSLVDIAVAILPSMRTETRIEIIAFQISGLKVDQIGCDEKSGWKFKTRTYVIAKHGVATHNHVLEKTNP